MLNDRGDDETALLCSMTEVMMRRPLVLNGRGDDEDGTDVLNDRGDDETALMCSMTEVMM